MTCVRHGEDILIPCKRWRECPGCGLRLQWQLRKRLEAGIARLPREVRETSAGELLFMPMFVTLTFPSSQAPTVRQAQDAWKSLRNRLRYRGFLSEYAWVLQRQDNAERTLHFHAIMHMPYFRDGLRSWRELLLASGFGVQNKYVPASSEHASYCSNYIASRLADLPRGHRAWTFSRGFPISEYERQKNAVELALGSILERHEWVPEYELRI